MFQIHIRKLFMNVFFIFSFINYHIANADLSIELHNSNLADAIRVIAKASHRNVIVSPEVQGLVNLSLNHTIPTQAFDMLLTAHDLAAWQMGDLWLVAPTIELIKHKKEELKWQEMWNETLPLTTVVLKIKYAKAEDISQLLKAEHASFLSKRGKVYVDVRTNIICIQDTSEHLNHVSKLIKLLDVPVYQIVIQARLASVDNDFERELGVNFSVKPLVITDDKSLVNQNLTSGHYSLAIAKLADNSLLDIKLAALENAGHAELISSPILFTADQQPASIEAGEEIPYQETSESGGTALVFKKAVLALKVTPQVLPNNKVLLQLQLNQDRPSNKILAGMPTISTRQLITNVLAKSGQTIVLGGIYETMAEEGQQRLPFISQIPIIGWLFKQKHIRNNKRELLIFVTPRIIAQEA